MLLRAFCSMLVMLVMLAVPGLAPAASPAQQDFQEASSKMPDLQRGARLFVTCAGCHGADGRGDRDGSVPVIAGQHARVIMRQLADCRHARRWNPRMQHYADNHVLPDAQAIADVAGHAASLARGGVGTGRGDLLAAGRQLHSAHCASCHGPTGEGDATTLVPRIGGQHYAYLLRVFHEAVEGARPNFPADHLRLLERFDGDQLIGLADALARF